MSDSNYMHEHDMKESYDSDLLKRLLGYAKKTYYGNCLLPSLTNPSGGP